MKRKTQENKNDRINFNPLNQQKTWYLTFELRYFFSPAYCSFQDVKDRCDCSCVRKDSTVDNSQSKYKFLQKPPALWIVWRLWSITGTQMFFDTIENRDIIRPTAALKIGRTVIHFFHVKGSATPSFVICRTVCTSYLCPNVHFVTFGVLCTCISISSHERPVMKFGSNYWRKLLRTLSAGANLKRLAI